MCRSGGVGGGGGRLVGLGSSSGNFRPILFISIIVKLSTTTKMKRTFLPSFEKFIFPPRFAPPKINLFSSNLIHHKKKNNKVCNSAFVTRSHLI